jgi:hypothetical protein
MICCCSTALFYQCCMVQTCEKLVEACNASPRSRSLQRSVVMRYPRPLQSSSARTTKASFALGKSLSRTGRSCSARPAGPTAASRQRSASYQPPSAGSSSPDALGYAYEHRQAPDAAYDVAAPPRNTGGENGAYRAPMEAEQRSAPAGPSTRRGGSPTGAYREPQPYYDLRPATSTALQVRPVDAAMAKSSFCRPVNGVCCQAVLVSWTGFWQCMCQFVSIAV